MKNSGEIYGAVISDTEVDLNNSSFIEYAPCDAKVFTQDIIEQVNKTWW